MATFFPLAAKDFAKSVARLRLALATSYAETSSISSTDAGRGGNSTSIRVWPSSRASCAARAEFSCSSKNDAGGCSRSDVSCTASLSSMEGGGTLYSRVAEADMCRCGADRD